MTDHVDTRTECKIAFPKLGYDKNPETPDDFRAMTPEMKASEKILAEQWQIPFPGNLPVITDAKIERNCQDLNVEDHKKEAEEQKKHAEEKEAERIITTAPDQVAFALTLPSHEIGASLFPLKAVDDGSHRYKFTKEEKDIVLKLKQKYGNDLDFPVWNAFKPEAPLPQPKDDYKDRFLKSYPPPNKYYWDHPELKAEGYFWLSAVPKH